MLKRRTFLAYNLLFLSGCTLAKTTTYQAEATVDWPQQLRFAVTDISGLEELKQDFESFRQALEVLLEIPVEFYPVENYSAAAPALLANELDIAFAGPSEYLILRARANAIPVIGVTRPSYHALVMTRIGSGIDTLADLQGKKIAMRTEGSTAGHIMPMKLLLDAGVKVNDYEILMLDREGFKALRTGQVDAWTDSYSRYVEFVKTPGLEDTEIQVIATSDNLPPDVFVINPSLGERFINEFQTRFLAHKDVLKSALIASEANQKYAKSELVVTQDADYQTLRDSYYAIGQGSTIE